MATYPSNIKVESCPTNIQVTAEFIRSTRIRICRLCSISPDAYDEAHYDLAEEWFRYHEYLEYTARVFMLSKTYHRWWNQQLAYIEDVFLRLNEGRDVSPALHWKILKAKVVSMEIHPSAELRREMHSEGTCILRLNPDLWKIKIYRDAGR